SLCSRLCLFFSSRRRHTRFSRDWSSDVRCSDLDENGSLFGLSASIGYQFMPNLGAEAGYRLSRASFEEGGDTVAFTASGFFAGEIGRASCRERVGELGAGGYGRRRGTRTRAG